MLDAQHSPTRLHDARSGAAALVLSIIDAHVVVGVAVVDVDAMRAPVVRRKRERHEGPGAFRVHPS